MEIFDRYQTAFCQLMQYICLKVIMILMKKRQTNQTVANLPLSFDQMSIIGFINLHEPSGQQ